SSDVCSSDLIPEFGHLDCLIAHDPFHIYTVDHHSLMGVRELERLRAGEFAKTLPHVTQVMREVERPGLHYLGMRFHDVGKGHGHDHSGRGARMMHDIATRLPPNAPEGAACEFLVRHHLLMSHLAQRRDMHDAQLVIDFCRTVGTLENLHRLYLLTYADMRAVGPGVWSTWRDTLVTELYVRAREFFAKGVFEAEDPAARAARLQGRVRETAPAEAVPALDVLFRTMPASYFLTTPEETIVAHAELRRQFGERETAGERPAVATQLGHVPEREYTEFAVCTRDRAGLFAMLSGVLAAHGLNILAARITTSRDRVGLLFTITNCLYHLGLEIHLAKITTMVDQVLDVFYVTDHQGRKIEDPARLEAIREALARALETDGTAAAAQAAGG